jgi:ankyrin repeat protein
MKTKKDLVLIAFFALFPVVVLGEETELNKALLSAALNGNLTGVISAINNGANLNVRNESGLTPLMGASYGGSYEIVKYLCEKGAKIELQLDEGESALFLAAQQGQSKIVEYLLNKGANPNVIRTIDGATPLIVSSQNGYIDVVRMLLNAGAKIDAKMNNGVTSLIAASIVGHEEIVKLLSKSGADTEIKVEGKKALDFAKDGGHSNIVSFLESFPAKSETSDACFTISEGQKNDTELKDEFLEKDYAVSFSVADHAEFEISKRWLSIQVTEIPNGYIRVHGTGDEKGEFQMGQKGGLVQIKIVQKTDNLVTVGIKAGDGNLEVSKKLHKRFQEILDSSSKLADEQATPQAKVTDDKILDRIIAESNDLFDQRNSPRCTLASIPYGNAPDKFSSEIMGFISWPKNYEPPKPCPYGEDDKERIVADGMFYTKVPSSIGEGGGFRCIGKFLVDKCLNPLSGIWDGKKDGAIHTITGRIRMFDYEFQSDDVTPLMFKLTKKGYLYVEGKGTVTDLKTGLKYTFPK